VTGRCHCRVGELVVGTVTGDVPAELVTRTSTAPNVIVDATSP